MSKIYGVVGILFGLSLSTLADAKTFGAKDSGIEATDRHIRGVITAVDAEHGTITIQGKKSTATGRVDPAKTVVLVAGEKRAASDLKVTLYARGELNLDEVWTKIEIIK